MMPDIVDTAVGAGSFKTLASALGAAGLVEDDDRVGGVVEERGAVEAGVPIVMAYMDYPRKLSGLGPVFRPTGDLQADMGAIKSYYAQFKGKNWHQFTTE